MGHRLIYRCVRKPISVPLTRSYGEYKAIKRPNLSQLKTPSKSSLPKAIEVIREKIRLTGPISVADYMNIVATNASDGYYTKKDVIGEHGDFITSPEISQLFSEMLAVWFYSETLKMGLPKPLQLVELGPGRATLLLDMLRVLNKLGVESESLSLHLVEISSSLQQTQAARLCLEHKQAEPGAPHYYEGTTVAGAKVYWYDDLKKVPRGFSWFVAHEFFDALPVHIFEKTPAGWRELLIDIDGSDRLEYKMSAEETNAVRLLVRPPLNTRGPRLEVSGRALGIARQIARRVDTDGGLLLVADYGHSGEKGDTFRAFHKHQLVDPLLEPGTSDLTADVDFSQLRLSAVSSDPDDNSVLVFGPVSQRDFLQRCQASVRLQVLIENAKSDEEKECLEKSYRMLTEPQQMGDRFKFMAFYPSTMQDILEKHPPLGFIDQNPV